ncbi:MAG: hypothetical protein WCA21_04380 [Terracidiphilus sp.]|jgi:hypothetical protein
MKNTENMIETEPLGPENTKGIVVNYRIVMAFLLLLAIGGAAFPLVYAWGPHEVLRRTLALLLGIAIPTPWVFVVRMNHRNMALLHSVKMNSEDRQGLLATTLQQSMSLLGIVYAVIIVLSGNLFSRWR